MADRTSASFPVARRRDQTEERAPKPKAARHFNNAAALADSGTMLGALPQMNRKVSRRLNLLVSPDRAARLLRYCEAENLTQSFAVSEALDMLLKKRGIR